MLMHPDELIPTRHSLLSRLKDKDDQESWKEFFDTYWRLVYGVAVKAGLNDADAQDVVQETVLSVAKGMPKYDPAAGSFKNWLLLITRRRIADHLRKVYREPPKHLSEPRRDETSRTSTIEKVPNEGGVELDAIWDEEWRKNLLDAAIERVRPQVDPKQFQIFDSYVIKQWPVKDVKQVLGVSAMQVYLAKHRISALIKKELEKLEKQNHLSR